MMVQTSVMTMIRPLHHGSHSPYLFVTPHNTSQQYDNGTREAQPGDIYRRQRFRITDYSLRLVTTKDKTWRKTFESLDWK